MRNYSLTGNYAGFRVNTQEMENLLHSFEMERNCLQLLAGLYEERLIMTEDEQKCV
ncbi:MAG: hypothetical protein J6X55_14035 [Victivallales bacterium]|nr:hypothetical protein [Victivallales bacterium]